MYEAGYHLQIEITGEDEILFDMYEVWGLVLIWMLWGIINFLLICLDFSGIKGKSGCPIGWLLFDSMRFYASVTNSTRWCILAEVGKYSKTFTKF